MHADAPLTPPLPAGSTTDCFVLRSTCVDEYFCIWVTVPPSYGKRANARFPVVYVTDGNTNTTVANAAYHLHAGDHLRPPRAFIQVTIGYADDATGLRFARRNRDFIPPGEPVSAAQITHVRAGAYARVLGEEGMRTFENHAANGAADRFLAFMETELHPEIAQRYRLDCDDVGLFGYSQGGMFSLYVLTTGSRLFSTFGAACPAIMTPDTTLYARWTALVADSTTEPRRRQLHLTTNDIEISGSVALYRLMGRECLRFIDLAQQEPLADLTLTTELILGETHFSGVFDAYRSFLRRFYRSDAPGG